MSTNTINPQNIPTSIIEDEKLAPEQRLERNGFRFHKRFLNNMESSFLTLLDSEGRILFFVAGALRRFEAKNHDQVVMLLPSHLTDGIASVKGKVYQPEYQVIDIKGRDVHRQYTLELRESPLLTTFLGNRIPEARSWGILEIGPNKQLRFIGHRPNGTNSEQFLNPRSWMQAEGPPVPGSGTNDLQSRMAPNAWHYAQSIPSAWTLAITASYLYGGMTTVPNATPIQDSAEIGNLIEKEMADRRERKLRQETQKAHRYVTQRAHQYAGQVASKTISGELGRLLDALGVPENVDEESTTLAASSPEQSGEDAS